MTEHEPANHKVGTETQNAAESVVDSVAAAVARD